MEKNNKEIQRQKLQDQIWWTRISRIKAETRLINKESFIQFVNIYYSIIAIICSVISFAYNDQAKSLCGHTMKSERRYTQQNIFLI